MKDKKDIGRQRLGIAVLAVLIILILFELSGTFNLGHKTGLALRFQDVRVTRAVNPINLTDSIVLLSINYDYRIMGLTENVSGNIYNYSLINSSGGDVSSNFDIFFYNPNGKSWIIADENSTINNIQLRYMVHSDSISNISGTFRYLIGNNATTSGTITGDSSTCPWKYAQCCDLTKCPSQAGKVAIKCLANGQCQYG